MAGMGWGGGKGRGALRAREIEASGLHDEIQDRRRGVSGNAGDAWDLEAGQKNKGEEKSRCSPTDRKMFQAKPSCTCFFSSGRFPINFFWFARSQEGSVEAAAGRARREKRKHQGPLVPLGLFLRPAARERCLVLDAWCCTFALAPWAASRALQSYLSEGATRIRIQLWGLALPSFPPWSTYRALDSYRLSALSREGGRVTHQHPRREAR